MVSVDQEAEGHEAEILSLLVKLSCYRKPIEPTTSINLDIGLDGDDAYELLETIQKRFGTRFDALDWHEYFHNEGECNLLSVWFRKIPGYKETRRSLTFQKLLEVVERGVWFES
jgi:acyl carrier protein